MTNNLSHDTNKRNNVLFGQRGIYKHAHTYDTHKHWKEGNLTTAGERVNVTV